MRLATWLLVLGVALMVQSTLQTDVYVSTKGEDKEGCGASSGSACATLKYCISSIAPSDSAVFVSPGTYDVSGLFIAQNNISIVASGGAVFFDCTAKNQQSSCIVVTGTMVSFDGIRYESQEVSKEFLIVSGKAMPSVDTEGPAYILKNCLFKDLWADEDKDFNLLEFVSVPVSSVGSRNGIVSLQDNLFHNISGGLTLIYGLDSAISVQSTSFIQLKSLLRAAWIQLYDEDAQLYPSELSSIRFEESQMNADSSSLFFQRSSLNASSTWTIVIDQLSFHSNSLGKGLRVQSSIVEGGDSMIKMKITNLQFTGNSVSDSLITFDEETNVDSDFSDVLVSSNINLGTRTNVAMMIRGSSSWFNADFQGNKGFAVLCLFRDVEPISGSTDLAAAFSLGSLFFFNNSVSEVAEINSNVTSSLLAIYSDSQSVTFQINGVVFRANIGLTSLSTMDSYPSSSGSRIHGSIKNGQFWSTGDEAGVYVKGGDSMITLDGCSFGSAVPVVCLFNNATNSSVQVDISGAPTTSRNSTISLVSSVGSVPCDVQCGSGNQQYCPAPPVPENSSEDDTPMDPAVWVLGLLCVVMFLLFVGILVFHIIDKRKQASLEFGRSSSLSSEEALLDSSYDLERTGDDL